MQATDLVGTWNLLSCEVRSEQGEVTYPLGREARGRLFYSAEGYMSVAIMAADRIAFGVPDITGGTLDEKAAAAESYVSYCGRFEVVGDTVRHVVDVSLFPNWVGATQERFAELKGNRLRLSTGPMPLGGASKTAHLIWERAVGPD